MARFYPVILAVSDIARVEAFYRDILGTPGRRVSPGRPYFDCGGTIPACFGPRADEDGRDSPPNLTG